MIAQRNIEYPECPKCGSDHAIRVSSAMLPDDSYDPKESGVFRCGNCREEYQFLKVIEAKEQVFSPTAQCPHCSSYKTKTLSNTAAKRYHICLEQRCLKSFKTLRPPNERASRRSES